MTFFFMGMSVAASTARLAEIKNNTGGSQSAFGAALMLGNIGSMFGNFIGARLIHRFGTRAVLRVAISLFVVAQISYGFVNQLWQVPITAFAAGASYALANIGANSQGSIIQQSAGKSLLPSFHGSWSIGALTASFVAGIAAKHFSPGLHILINSIVALIGVLIFYKYLLPHSSDHEDQKANSELQQHQEIPSEIKKFIFLLSICATFAMIAESSIGDWSTMLLHDDFKIALGLNTYGYTSFILVQTIARFNVGRLIDKYGIQKVMKVFGISGGIVYAAGLLIAKGLSSHSSNAALVTMCITYALLGVGMAPMSPSFASIAGQIRGIPTARAVARMQMNVAFGFLIGRGVLSALTKLIGLPLALLLPALALIASGIIAYRLNPFEIKS